MKKLFTLALALCTLSVFAQTNLFDASKASVLSTWGAGGINPTASWNADYAQLDIVLNTDQAGWQWGNQVALAHNVDFETGKYYKVVMLLYADKDCNNVTLKIDDSTGMIYENQTINLTANVPSVYESKAVAGVPGDHKMVFDFGFGAKGTELAVYQIYIFETEAPVIDLCDGTAVATSEQQKATLAIDGNTGTRWESKSADGDDVKWQMNLAEATTFNRIKIVWEGAYGKSFKINAGTTCDNLTTIASIEDQSLAGFPYTQIIELSESVTASHIQFEGIKRGTPYGYSFFEFEVYTAQTSVLTSLDFSAAATISAVGGTVALTATPKDQYGAAMEETVTYSVEPATAGHVEGGVYTADAFGLATITATCGTLTKTVEIFNYTGENVALNKTATGEGFNDITRVNDGNNSTEYQADKNDGKEGHDVVSEFVIDLGAEYDLNLVTIFFEGACSQEYTLETSADNVNFAVAYTYVGKDGIWGHTDYLFGANLANAEGVRYIKFHSTKNATDWGCKIFELSAYGVEHTPTALPAAAINGKAVKLIKNGNIVIIRDGVRYNAQGAKL